MSTLTIVNVDGTILKKSPMFIKRKTSLDILKSIPQVSDGQYLLAIKAPTYMKILRPDSTPYTVYPNLIDDNPADLQSIPDFSLQIVNKSERGKFFFIFNPSSPENPEIIFPPFVYGFIPSNYSKKQVSDFISDIATHFGLPITNPKILLNNEEISPDQKFKIFFNKVSIYVKNCLIDTNKKMRPIEFQFHLEPEGLKKIKHREDVLKEILDTEESYCKMLQTLNDYFQPAFEEHKILNETDQQAIFGPIPPMIETSLYLSTEISKRQSYSSCIASTFSNILFNFKQTSIEYFVNYNLKISPIITSLDNNPQIQKICDESPNCPGITFQSVLIQPIQRFPRYPLLLRELLKNTPESHPDHFPLQLVSEEVGLMVHELADAHLVSEARDLKERLTESLDKPPIFIENRSLIKPFLVRLKEKWRMKINLYLFNDLLLLTTGNEKEEIEYLRCEYAKLVFIPNLPDSSSITLYFDDEFKTIEFSSIEQIQLFKTILNECRQKIFDSDENKSLLSIRAIEYFPLDDQTIWPMIDSSCCRSGDSIIAVSRRNYHTYLVSNQSLTGSDGIKSIHKHSKLVIIQNSKFIFGGTKNVGPFELFDKKFIEAKPKNSINPTKLELIEKLGATKINHSKDGRIFHTCCAYDSYIVVFGGINPKNSKRTFSDVNFYSIETGEWFECNSSIKPDPRFKHSAVVYNDVMIIHGGINSVNNQLMKDTWSFNFLNGEWTLLDFCDEKNVVPRFGHAAVIVNHFMFIIGGSTSDPTLTTLQNENENDIEEDELFIDHDLFDTNDTEINEEYNENDNNIDGGDYENVNDAVEHESRIKKLKKKILKRIFKRKSKRHQKHINKRCCNDSDNNNNNNNGDFMNDDDDSSDDNDNENDDENEMDECNILSATFFSKNCYPAPDCFCLNIEDGKIDNIEIVGNYINGLSMFSAAYDDVNSQIIIFGGVDPKKHMEKGIPSITLLDIPQHYKMVHHQKPQFESKSASFIEMPIKKPIHVSPSSDFEETDNKKDHRKVAHRARSAKSIKENKDEIEVEVESIKLKEASENDSKEDLEFKKFIHHSHKCSDDDAFATKKLTLHEHHKLNSNNNDHSSVRIHHQHHKSFDSGRKKTKSGTVNNDDEKTQKSVNKNVSNHTHKMLLHHHKHHHASRVVQKHILSQSDDDSNDNIFIYLRKKKLRSDSNNHLNPASLKKAGQQQQDEEVDGTDSDDNTD